MRIIEPLCLAGLVAVLLIVSTSIVYGQRQYSSTTQNLYRADTERRPISRSTSLQASAAECDGRETWIPVGAGDEIEALDNNDIVAATNNGELYILFAASHDTLEQTTEYQLNKWTGDDWIRLTSLSMKNSSVNAMHIYQNEIYVGGNFGSVNGIPGTLGLVKWDGIEWAAVGEGFGEESLVNDFAIYKDELIVAGYIIVPGDVDTVAAISWDGRKWEHIGGGIGGFGYVSGESLAADDDWLYVSGWFEKAGGLPIRNYAAYNGERWIAISQPFVECSPKMISYKGELFVAPPSPRPGPPRRLAKWNGNEWEAIDLRVKSEYTITDFAEYRCNLYAVGWIQGEFAEEYLSIFTYNGNEWSTISGFDGIPSFAVSSESTLYCGGRFSTSCGRLMNHVAQLCDDSNCSKLSGAVFEDVNGDCVMNPDETPLSNGIIVIRPGPYYAYVDEHGRYEKYVTPGEYEIEAVARPYWRKTCPESGNSLFASLPEIGDESSGHNFAYSPQLSVEALEISLIGGYARPGGYMDYHIRYQNIGSMPFTGVIMLRYDERKLSFVGASVEEFASDAGMITWHVADIPVAVSGSLHAVFQLPPDPSLIDAELCASASSFGEIQRRESEQNDYCIITGDQPGSTVMSVRPAGTIVSRDPTLEFTIRFQNTSADTITRVTVFNTIPDELDPSTLRIGAASHDFSFTIADFKDLTWTFDNITLPDSATNEPESHGFLKYSIRLKQDTPNDAVIDNSSEVIYGCSESVTTNTVRSVLSAPMSTPSVESESSLRAYPNPTRDRFFVTGITEAAHSVRVLDIFGNIVHQTHCDGRSKYDFDMSHTTAGVYFVTVEGKSGRWMQPVMVTK